MAEPDGSTLTPAAGREGAGRLPPNFNFQIVRSFQDGDRMFLHAVQHLRPNEDWVSMSLIKMDPGGQSELVHQILSPVIVTNNPDATMVAGHRAVRDLEHTEANKARVRAFVDAVLVGGDVERTKDFVPLTSFFSHNPLMMASRGGFISFLRDEMSRDDPLAYEPDYDLVGQGNFAAIFGRISFRGRPAKAADLFRLDGDRIVEHWDVAQYLDDAV